MSAKKVLVYGGRGALGSTCVSKFKELNWVRNWFLVLIIFQHLYLYVILVRN